MQPEEQPLEEKPQYQLLSNPLLEITPAEPAISISIRIALDSLSNVVSRVREKDELDNEELNLLINNIESKYWKLISLPLTEEKRRNIEEAFDIIEKLRNIPMKINEDYELNFFKQKFSILISSLNSIASDFTPTAEQGFDIYKFHQMLVMMEQDWQNSLMRESWCNTLEAVFSQFKPLFMKKTNSPKLMNSYVIKKINRAMPMLSEIRAGTGNIQQRVRELKGLYLDLATLYSNLGNIEEELAEKLYVEEKRKGETPLEAMARDKAKQLSKILDYFKEKEINSVRTAINKRELKKELGWEGMDDNTYRGHLKKLTDNKWAKYRKVDKESFYYISNEGLKYKKEPYFKKYLM